MPDNSGGAETLTTSKQPVRRLLISEEGLIDEVGHWYEYCKSVSDIHAELGIECLVAMHRDAKDSVRKDISAFPVYPQTSWSGLNSQPNIFRRYMGILAHNAVVYRTMAGLIRKIGPVSVVFAPTVAIHHLIGWRLFAAIYGRRKFNRLVLLFRNNVGFYTKDSDTPKFRRASYVLVPILRSFSHLLKNGSVVLATDSERLAGEYEALCGLRPTVFPSPRIACASDEMRRDSAKASILFSCLGPARFEKGVDILQQAIKLVLARRASQDMLFVVQWNADIKDDAGGIYPPDPELLQDRRVQLLTKSLSSDEYDAEISRTDCMVLPYRRDSYFARISGVAVEGVTAGKPVIYTLGTWCEDLVKNSGAGIGVPDGDISSLAGAIEELANNFTIYKAQATARAAAARESNSAEAFVEKLWGPLLSDV